MYLDSVEGCCAGDVLLAEAPAATVLMWSEWALRCGACLEKRGADQLQTCGGCGLERYCSEICQKRRWKAQHKAECLKLRALRAQLDGPEFTDAVLCLRALQQQSPAKAMSWLGPTVQDCYDMASPSLRQQKNNTDAGSDPSEANDAGRKNHRCAKIATVLSKATDHITFESSLSMLLRIAPSAFMIHDADRIDFAYGFFPHTALVNHACAANCIATFELPSSDCKSQQSVVLKVRALESIKPGAELVHCYADLLLPVWARQQRLKVYYDFVCHCTRCSASHALDIQQCGTPDGTSILDDTSLSLLAGPSTDAALEARISQVRAMYVSIDKITVAPADSQRDMDLKRAFELEVRLQRSGKTVAALEAWKSILMHRSKHVHCMSHFLADTHRNVADVAVALGEWQTAIACLEKIAAARDALLPALHPQRTIASTRLGYAHLRAARDLGSTFAEERSCHLAASFDYFQKSCGDLETLFGSDVSRMPYIQHVYRQRAEAEAAAKMVTVAVLPQPCLSMVKGQTDESCLEEMD